MNNTMVDTCLYIYAIVDARCASLDADVHADVVTDVVAHNGLQIVRCGPVAAVCECLHPDALAGVTDDEAGARLAELARRHDRIVRDVALHTTVLPVRLGTLCADPERLTRTLGRSRRALEAQLDTVRDCAEWTVRALRAGPFSQTADVPGGSGADYLQARRSARVHDRQRGAAAEAAVRRIGEQLAHLSRTVRARAGVGPGVLLAQNCLVPMASRFDFADLVHDARDELGALDVQLDVEGPLPPYSFVDVRLAAAP